MNAICESCVLYGFCDGRCGDTDPLYYWEEKQNDARDERERYDTDNTYKEEET